jgi:hypothetical protein
LSGPPFFVVDRDDGTFGVDLHHIELGADAEGCGREPERAGCATGEPLQVFIRFREVASGIVDHSMRRW